MRKYILPCLGLLLSLGLLAIVRANLAGQDLPTAWYFLHFDIGPGWQTTINVTNLENEKLDVDAFAYDKEGRSIAEIPVAASLEAQAAQALDPLPLRPETVKLESKGSVWAVSLLKTLDGAKSEAIPAIQQPSRQLDFPQLLKGDQDNKTISLLNIDVASANLEVIGLDSAW